MCNSNLFASNVVLQSINILPPKEGGQMVNLLSRIVD